MVHMDALPLLERLVAHRAGVFLCRENQVEFSWVSPQLEIRYLRLDLLRDSFDSRCGWERLYSRWRSMASAVLQNPS